MQGGVNILVIRSGAFGDVLCTTPAIHRLREQVGPSAIIDVQTHYPQIFKGSPDVNRADSNLDHNNYTVIHDLNGSYEKRLRRVSAAESYMEDIFGDRDGDKTLRVAKVNRPYIYDLVGGKYITIHPAISWQNRTLPLSFWQALADRLGRAHYKVVVVGTGRDRRLLNVIDSRDVVNMHQQAALINDSACYVGSDCGGAVLWATTEAPGVYLSTISPPEMDKFWRHGELNWKMKRIVPDLPCVGCGGRQATIVTHHGCERGDFACVDMFDPDVVASAVMEMAE